MRVSESITPKGLCDYLNDLLQRDLVAINALMSMRVHCNNSLISGSGVQAIRVGYDHSKAGSDPKHAVGLMGILNGVFGVDSYGFGCIRAEVECDSETGHVRITRFVLTPSPE